MAVVPSLTILQRTSKVLHARYGHLCPSLSMMITTLSGHAGSRDCDLGWTPSSRTNSGANALLTISDM